jgi:DNA polymerase (family 10)
MKTTLDRHRVAEILSEIATLLELKGENPFKVRAYANAARLMEGLDRDLGELIETGGLKDLKGIGATLTEQITSLAKTGAHPFYAEIRSGFPESLLDLLRVPGLGPKKVKILHDKLGITSLGELEYACRENRLLDLEGFGEKTQTKVMEGLAYVRRNEGRFLYASVADRAAGIAASLGKIRGVMSVSVAGSLRRGKEIVRNIDIVCASTDPAEILRRFVKPQDGPHVNLMVVAKEEFPSALLHFTGSEEHNAEMRALAEEKGLKLDEHGLFKGEVRIPCRTEEEIFKALGLHFIPPELREAMGEIEAARKREFPALVEPEDLKGVLHVHTAYSDGRNSLAEMVAAAEAMGLKYVGVSDHSRSAAYARGLKEADLNRQEKELDGLRAEFPKLRIFWGIESDILADGSLDYPDSVLKRFDFVVASVHSRFNMMEEEMTKRCMKALENRYCTMLGHPTGRLLLAREAFKVNLNALIDRAAELGKFMELNANPQRLDLDWRVLRYAKERGVPVSINPDAHDVEGLKDIRFGVIAARKGGLTPEDVLNTRSAARMEEALEKARA